MEEQPGFLQEWFAEHLFVPLRGWAFWAALLGTVVLYFGLLMVLQALPPTLRRKLTVALTFLAGLIYAVEFFWPEQGNPLTGYITPLGAKFLPVMFSFTIGLGIISLAMVHGRNILRRRPGWGNSVAFFVAMILTIGAGFWNLASQRAAEAAEASPSPLAFPSVLWRLCEEGLLFALDSTMFSVLAFFIVSAAYRAFRVRSVEAGLMMFTAFIIMLGQVPVGMILTSWLPSEGPLAWLRLERLSNWILTGINAAAIRAILFGAMMGYLAIALRTWLSLERGAYFGAED